ncbi:Glycosyltransferase, GT2 family [Alkalispirochaeta americana]|uniref:Glycosyltransferase, GT2 family n=1 Tax=Alkalispirochaeta americana TaxID=159291 RepID=A0A1N6RUI5_9SPIO|nr:glycosyltransferase [Alkalispirochaeta americana]SIQ32495.1 Glycosyltransferase, GT2 family [Alkalispirochaeta americana]
MVDTVLLPVPIPSVTVICPFYNLTPYLDRLLPSLASQDYPGPSRILLVDNRSTDGSPQVCRDAGFTVLSCDHLASSYAARNVGIRNASGDILAFIDADCAAAPDWLSRGVSALEQSGADFLAGNVLFEFRNPHSPWEQLEAALHMDNEALAAMGRAVTANVFVRRSLFGRVGLYREHQVSGEDVAWSLRAVAAGARLAYCPRTVVYHPTRDGRESLKKAFRVGRGMRAHRAGAHGLGVLKRVIRSFLPPSLGPALRALRGKGYPARSIRIIGPLWALSLCKAAGLVRESAVRAFVSSQPSGSDP